MLTALSAHAQSAAAVEPVDALTLWAQHCARCHGADGRGEVAPELLVAMGMAPRDLTAPYLNSGQRRSDWLRIVRHGGPALGLSAAMPAWGQALSEAQMVALVDALKALVPEERYPQGELSFVRAQRVKNAYPDREVSLSVDGDALARGVWAGEVGFTARFLERAEWEVNVPAFTDGQRASLGDVGAGLKYVLAHSRARGLILSSGVGASFPTGGSNAVRAKPYLAFGFSPVRVLELQWSGEASLPIANPGAVAAVSGGMAATLALPEGKRGLFPMVEVWGERSLELPAYGVWLLPGAAWRITPSGRVSLAASAVLSLAGSTRGDVGMRGYLSWEWGDGRL